MAKTQPRPELPADLNPLLLEINKAVDGAKRDVKEIAEIIGTKPGNLYAWLRGRGAPSLRPMEAMLNQIGSRLEIIEAEGVAAKNLREAVRDDPNRMKVAHTFRNRQLEGVHPTMVEVYELFEALNINRTRLCADAGLSRGTFQRWLTPVGDPLLIRLDEVLRQAGYRFKVSRGLIGRRRPDVTPAAPVTPEPAGDPA